ncbi:MAG: M48 family metalloprotease [Gammaproteobacteria bacterium]|nr:M48 family metalloprotease [Gammaproteobacteria bacterium]
MNKNIKNTIIIPFAIATSLTLAGCSANQLNAGLGAAGSLFKGFSITNEELAAQARLSAKAMDKKSKVASSRNKYSRRLRKLTRKLKTHDGLKFNYKVYISKQVNAFAMPDGTVRVYSGLMDIMNDNELLAVIGHEIGHVKYQHSLNQYKKAYIAKAAKAGIAAYGKGTASALAGQYGDIGLNFLNARFSQNDELQSDEYGVKVLHKLGRDPYAAASAQRKLQSLGGGKGGLFSSHPPSKTRIQKATKAADKITGK